MLKRLLAGSLLGGLILFAWGVFSWMVMPWHQNTLEKFTDEPAVADALQAYTGKDGVYILPNPHRQAPDSFAAADESTRLEALERMRQGPFAFVAVSRSGSDPQSPLPYVRGLLINILTAAIISWMLMNARLPGYSCRLGFTVFIGMLAGFMVLLPQWNWWQFSPAYTLIGFADLLIGCFLAGLALAGIAVKPDAG